HYETVRRSFRYKHPDLASQAEAVKRSARSRARRKRLLEARQSVLAEDEVGLWKCATIDLMSDEEDGIVGRVSGWIVRPPSFRNQELTERHAAVEIRGDSKVQGNAPQTSAKWTEFRQNAASYLQLRSGKQTFHGAVGFWASHTHVYAYLTDSLRHTYQSPACLLPSVPLVSCVRPDQHRRPSMSQPDPFQALVDALRRTLTTNPPSPSPVTSPSPAPVTTVSTVSSSSPPVYASPMARPAPYSGSAEDCSGFLLQCELVLEMQPHLYPNDTWKIAFLISQLNGKALTWADSIWSQHGTVTQSYSAFISHFREVFGKNITDSSAGEKLYNLKQGAMSLYDYALQFRTLAAVCACEDTIGLENFIQHSIRCATRMQACLQEHQDQFLPISSLCRSEPVSSPEPANEPMEVENSRLTSSEQQHRLTLHLCLYCGAPGHVISACPIRPPRPMVSAIIPSIKKMKPLSTVVNLTAADVSLTVVALLDSGSAGNFISGALCRQLRLKTSPSPTIYQINSITGRPLSRKHVRRIGGPLKLKVGLLHREDIHLLVLEDSTADVVLGHPWLEQHNPTISWNTGEILKWGETCFSGCISELPEPRIPPSELSIGNTSIESPVEKRSIEIPECYAPFSDVFCPQRASKLPPHRPWDCAIDLIPGEPVPRGKIYPLAIPEEKAMDEYIKEALAQGYIRPSTSPAASSFFFVAKKDGGPASTIAHSTRSQ
ncbi:Retrotransposon-derived protein PEG10, partial [Anabarilius grahami]